MSRSNRTTSVSHLIQSLKDEFEIRPVGQAALTREIAEVVLMQISTTRASYYDDSSGWLVGLVRAPRSFESSQIATLQLAASLFDTLVQLRQASHEQDRAAGAVILGQALAFRPQWNHAELQGKLLAQRISFEERLYVAVFGLSEFPPQTQCRHLSRLAIEVQSLLSSHSIRHLKTEADQVGRVPGVKPSWCGARTKRLTSSPVT